MTEPAPVLARMGDAVRAARHAKGMPRRVLSEISGVSPRYLAQVESGQGNISVALLHRVATALDLQLSDLFADTNVENSAQLLDLFKRADAATQTAVLHRLEAAAEVPDRAQRICLIGLRGAGKSTLGRAAGEALGLHFVELNAEIEAQGGMPVAEIMALYGADGYRRLEAEAVRRVAVRQDRMILAVAGGIVSDAQAYTDLLARFHTIWVKAAPQEHMARVLAQGDQRPMEGRPQAMEQLRALLEERTPEYARADAALDTTGKSVAASQTELLNLIKICGFLD